MADGAFDASDNLIPAAILLQLVRDVWQPLEVKTVLAVAAVGGLHAAVREIDVLAHDILRTGVRRDGSDRDVGERILEALDLATARGVLLRLVDEEGNRWLLIGTEENQRRVRSQVAGAVDQPAPWGRSMKLERPGIFTVYEQNIGLVTPIVADRLVEAIERYPESWIEDAIAEAVSYNRRSWRYIQRILENWATEGRTDETHRGGSTRDLTREKHLRGKYAHLFRRDEMSDV